MTIQLQMTGTGDAFAKRYYNNNALIRTGGYNLMIDFGQTAPLALHSIGVSLQHIHGVLITHLHADHIGGLEELAFDSMYNVGHGQRGKIQLFVPDTLVDLLWDHALKAGLADMDAGHTSLDSYYDVRPLVANKPVTIHDGLVVEIVETIHIPGKKSYSIFMNDRIFYSSDLIFDRELLHYVVEERHCDIILHECQLSGKGVVHTTLDELLSLPEHIQSRIFLMHYNDSMPQYVGRTGKMSFLEQHRIYTL